MIVYVATGTLLLNDDRAVVNLDALVLSLLSLHPSGQDVEGCSNLKPWQTTTFFLVMCVPLLVMVSLGADRYG